MGFGCEHLSIEIREMLLYGQLQGGLLYESPSVFNYYKSKTLSGKERTREQKQLRCYICNSPNHLAHQCKQSKTESTGRKEAQSNSGSGMKMIQTNSYLCAKKSGSWCVRVMVGGVSIIVRVGYHHHKRGLVL